MSRPEQVDYWEGALQLLYNKISLKIIDHGSRSTWAQVLPDPDFGAQKYDPLTKTDLPYNFFMKFLPSLTVEAVDAPQTLVRASLTPGVGVQD
jgi:hypothetical protein